MIPNLSGTSFFKEERRQKRHHWSIRPSQVTVAVIFTKWRCNWVAYETTNYCNLVLIPVKFPLRTDPLAKLDLSARFFLAKEPLAFRFRSRFLVNQKNLCLFSSQQHGFGFTIKKTLWVNKKTTTYMFCIVLPYSKPTMLQLSGFFVLTPISILNTSKSGFCGFVDLVNFDPVTLFFFFRCFHPRPVGGDSIRRWHVPFRSLCHLGCSRNGDRQGSFNRLDPMEFFDKQNAKRWNWRILMPQAQTYGKEWGFWWWLL